MEYYNEQCPMERGKVKIMNIVWRVIRKQRNPPYRLLKSNEEYKKFILLN